MQSNDQRLELIENSKQSLANNERCIIQGGSSKSFLINHAKPVSTEDNTVSTIKHSGVIEYDPSELVITARSGTNLQNLIDTISEHGQRLPFEPPKFSQNATIGGTIACGISGPSRPYSGAIRDHILGVELINGKAQAIQFGGKVMKNVAGYDVSRLQCGAFGTLGLLLQVSIKLLPAPQIDLTLTTACSEEDALSLMVKLAQLPLPISGTLYHNNQLWLRLSGFNQAIDAAVMTLKDSANFTETEMDWRDIREQESPIFDSEKPLYRLSLPANTESSPHSTTIEWSGAQRWFQDESCLPEILQWTTKHKGHLTNFRTGEHLTSRPKALEALSQKIKNAFNSTGLWNPHIQV